MVCVKAALLIHGNCTPRRLHLRSLFVTSAATAVTAGSRYRRVGVPTASAVPSCVVRGLTCRGGRPRLSLVRNLKIVGWHAQLRSKFPRADLGFLPHGFQQA